MGFRLASGPSSLEDIRDGLFHPTAAYTKGMIDWEAAQKVIFSLIPFLRRLFETEAAWRDFRGHF